MVNNEKQSYFQTQEKLDAIGRVNAGERHFSVAHSLGITCETLSEWISNLSSTHCNQDVKAVNNSNFDLLDRTLYTWFIQQIGMDLRPTKDALKRKAEVFSTRLYGTHEGIVSDIWVEKWQDRHRIKEKKQVEHFDIQEVDLIYVDAEVKGSIKENENEDKEPVCYVFDSDNLDGALYSFLSRDTTQKSIEKEFLDLKMKLDKITEDFAEVDKSFKDLRSSDDEIRLRILGKIGKENNLGNGLSDTRISGLAKDGKSELTSEVVHIGQKSLERHHLPPFGPIKREKLCPNSEVYAMKSDLLGSWIKGLVIEVIPQDSATGSSECEMYRVRTRINKKPVIKLLSGKHLAYLKQPAVTLPVGTRVVAQFKHEVSPHLNDLYAGIIAEPPKITNNQRYLIFFDDGYAQYVKHNEVFLVCESAKEVWKDIHKDFQNCIKAYLEKYPERPMVKVQKKQVVKVEWNGSWWSAVVLAVDASLMHVCFEADKRTEWLYRGSTRLAPLYNELTAKDENRLTAKVRRMHLKRKHQPYVEYTTSMEEQPNKQAEEAQTAKKPIKNTARKSTTMESGNKQKTEDDHPRIQAQSRMISQEGTITTDRLPLTRLSTFTPHTCCSECNFSENERSFRGQNPLRIPMLCGWLRLIVKQRNKRIVCYSAPCGRRLRSIDEVFRYLTRTKSKLGIDVFSFDYYVHTFSQFKPSSILTYIKDITYGKEPVPVCLVNNLSKEYPPVVAYSAKRFPRDGVVINTDPEFLCGCDCEDNCENKEKCQCQQLTVNATAANNSSGEINADAGYTFRRLPGCLVTGVYECNSRCKCKSSCLNRVVQNGLQVRLQVFKTEHRGWGIRCLDDLPQGIFICIYAGQVSNEDGAIEDAKMFGDEYHAELDHIEVVEAGKSGYESGVEDIEAEEQGQEEENQNDSEDSSENEDSEIPVPPKVSVYESDSDYNPPTNWTSVGKDITARRRCNSRVSSKDSDSSGKTTSSESNKNARDKLLRGDESTHEMRSKSDGDDTKDLNDGASVDKTSRKKSSAAIGSSSCDMISNENENRPKSLRSYFGEDFSYILDAKKCGNIGRYLNHSCDPNVFVQNVFVDTHDLRFPWVAFFALDYIRAGTELTWDYHYELDSVPGKHLSCYCGSKCCKRRLI